MTEDLPLLDRRAAPSAYGEASVAQRLGLALQVMFRRGCYLEYPLASIKAWLLPAVQLQQVHIFVGEDQKLLGYMTWAWFTAETEERWKRGAIDVLHISEWNEGDRLWILDFVCMPGMGKLCFWLAPGLFPAGTVAHSFDHKRAALKPEEASKREDPLRAQLSALKINSGGVRQLNGVEFRSSR